ncbi:MAG: hypothetical protein IPH04_15860 [Saprospirales bacterium]|nr:hypothetical protein [Saprospirales bacterium]
MIYTTNPVEAFSTLFANSSRAKLLGSGCRTYQTVSYLSLMHNEKCGKERHTGWKAIQRDLTEKCGERFSRRGRKMKFASRRWNVGAQAAR